ncbi:MAG: YkgJ family cysteine cluster protein [Actinomycetota bacterium]|nr:YkgJ family cysteine cluster protein [Actinomycetota bacterium]
MPCGDCTACCTSSQFIHIEPDETGTISRIPKELLFPAPGLPRGDVVMGYDEHGHCPMFVDGRCSIYEHRPRTCRAYDCRVLPAAGLRPDRDETVGIARRTERWRFAFPTERDRRLQAAVQAAATFLNDHRRELPEGAVPGNPTQLAFLAVQIHDVFLDGDDDPDRRRPVDPTLDVVATAVRRARSPRS